MVFSNALSSALVALEGDFSRGMRAWRHALKRAGEALVCRLHALIFFSSFFLLLSFSLAVLCCVLLGRQPTDLLSLTSRRLEEDLEYPVGNLAFSKPHFLGGVRLVKAGLFFVGILGGSVVVK